MNWGDYMRRILIITTYKKTLTGLALLVLVIVIICLLFIDVNNWKTIQIFKTKDNEEVKELIKENARLKGTLERILPNTQKVLYENPYRFYGNRTIKIDTISPEEVIKKGKDIKFNVSYKIPEYLRPIYDPYWSKTYYRGWIDLVSKVEEARHRLFIFPLGASSSYDFTGSLGFDGSPRVDAHRNINFLIYHFEVEEVKLLGQQIVLVGKPRRTGVEVISVNKDDLFTDDEGAGDFLIQLSTPSGYEIDFIYEMNVMKYEYLKKKIEEHTVKPKPSFLNKEEKMSLEELKKENKLLKKELAEYIPIQVEEVITEDRCRQWSKFYREGETFNVETACKKGMEIEYETHYRNLEYRRPIYHPSWKKNVKEGWAYVPSKVCDNLHILFILKGNCDEQSVLLGKLGFFKKYSSIQKDKIGFLIYNFNIDKVIKYNNQIIIKGTPSRNGAEIISIDSSLLLSKKSYLVQLVTPDCIEVDYDILKAN